MRAVLFDIDNTLLIKSPGISEKWQAVLLDFGIEVSLTDAQRAFAECEMWVGEQIRRENETGIRLSDEAFTDGVMNCCLRSLNAPQRCKSALANVWVGRYPITYRIAEDAVEARSLLRDSGMILGIVSNNRSSIRRALDDLKLTEFFQTIVISEEVNLYKPDPRILGYACETLGVRCEDALYVGDHPFDVVCAHDAGLCAAWIPVNEFMRLPEGTAEPEYRLATLKDILKWV